MSVEDVFFIVIVIVVVIQILMKYDKDVVEYRKENKLP